MSRVSSLRTQSVKPYVYSRGRIYFFHLSFSSRPFSLDSPNADVLPFTPYIHRSSHRVPSADLRISQARLRKSLQRHHPHLTSPHQPLQIHQRLHFNAPNFSIIHTQQTPRLWKRGLRQQQPRQGARSRERRERRARSDGDLHPGGGRLRR